MLAIIPGVAEGWGSIFGKPVATVCHTCTQETHFNIFPSGNDADNMRYGRRFPPK